MPPEQPETQLLPKTDDTSTTGVSLKWENISVVLPPKKSLITRKLSESKTILNNVSGYARPGSLLAIMGASGSGKTTLLNALTHRFGSDLKVSGSVTVNGESTDGKISKISAYIQQDDLFFGVLTVREHLQFQASLRMNVDDEALRKQRVEDVLTELGLGKCADSPIGNPAKGKCISGGERKRLAFASEILNNPSLLFCDEPTTGLDSYTAISVVQSLKAMTAQGKTILCTIHQPSSQIFSLFDNFLLLSNGNVVYMGSAAGAKSFFASAGYTCPSDFNPADFYINTVAIIPGQEAESKERVQKLVDAFSSSKETAAVPADESPDESCAPGDISLNMDSPAAPLVKDDEGHVRTSTASSTAAPKYKTSYANQFRQCVWRSTVAMFRARELFFARICQTLVVALFTGLLYLRQDNDQKGVQNINGALFLIVTNTTFSNAYSVLHSFPRDIPIVKREYQTGMYSIFVYYLSKMFADFLVFTILPTGFATIIYWMVGMKPDWQAFLIFLATVVYLAHVVVSFGYFVSAVAGDAAVATILASPLMIPLMLFSGFMLNDASIPIYFSWLAHLSWFKYANEILVVNQWHHFGTINCEFENSTIDSLSNVTQVQSSRCFQNGEEVLTSLSYSIDNQSRNFIALALLFVGFRLAGYIFLLLRIGKLNSIKPSAKSSKTGVCTKKSKQEPSRNIPEQVDEETEKLKDNTSV